jgi:hypothetical protein
MTGPTPNGTRPCNALLYTIGGLFAAGMFCVALLEFAPGEHSVTVAVIGGMAVNAVSVLLSHFNVQKGQQEVREEQQEIRKDAQTASQNAAAAAVAAQVVAVTSAETAGARDVQLRFNTAKTVEAVEVGRQNVEAIQSVKAGCDGNFAQVLEKLLASEHANARLHELLGEKKEAAKSEALADAGRRRSEREERGEP